LSWNIAKDSRPRDARAEVFLVVKEEGIVVS
jgi:hypothetical protein